MNTHARRGEAGFSFVELLVTIIIAGIAFAAMVPLFVSAQKQTSADNMRNVTMQVAQDKIEKIRQLDYDQITQANLDDEDFAQGQFGNVYEYRGGSGATRDLIVTYVVTLVPETLPDGTTTPEGRENYKQVAVEVTWTGPPEPIRAATLTTTIYRQFAGASIQVFSVGPSSIFSSIGGKDVISGGPVVLDVYIAAEDIDGMNADLGDPTIPENRRRMGYVEFTISSANGFGPVRNKVYLPVTGDARHYRYTWDNATAAEGTYLFEAVAVAGTQQKGRPASAAYTISRSAPPRPTGLSLVPADGTVYLSWDPSPVGDLSHYEVYRSPDGTSFAMVADDQPAPSYTDTGLTNEATYYYYVYAVDADGNRSAPSTTLSATPRVVSDSDPPTAPTGLTASPVSNTPTVALQWSPSTDVGTGVKGYTIERSADSVTWLEVQGTYAPTDYIDATAGWGMTWFYRVQAVDNAGNSSAWSVVVGPVTTASLPLRILVVVNGQALNLKAWVQNVATGYWYSKTGAPSLPIAKPGGTPIGKLGASVTWTNLPAGTYNVTNDAGYPTQAIDLTYGNGSVTI